jgi:hypothetical protein
MLTRIEQIAPAAHEILSMSWQPKSLQRGISALLRSTNKFSKQQSHQADDGM